MSQISCLKFIISSSERQRYHVKQTDSVLKKRIPRKINIVPGKKQLSVQKDADEVAATELKFHRPVFVAVDFRPGQHATRDDRALSGMAGDIYKAGEFRDEARPLGLDRQILWRLAFYIDKIVRERPRQLPFHNHSVGSLGFNRRLELKALISSVPEIREIGQSARTCYLQAKSLFVAAALQVIDHKRWILALSDVNPCLCSSNLELDGNPRIRRQCPGVGGAFSVIELPGGKAVENGGVLKSIRPPDLWGRT